MVSMAERAFEFTLDEFIFMIILDHISLNTFSAGNLRTTIQKDGLASGSIENHFAKFAEQLNFLLSDV